MSNPLSFKTIKLKTGGEITITIITDPFKLTGPDREFVFKLIDLLYEYEEKNAEASSELKSASTYAPA